MALTSGDTLRIIGTHGRRTMASKIVLGFDRAAIPDTVLRANLCEGRFARAAEDSQQNDPEDQAMGV
jgi:hypothetical protein